MKKLFGALLFGILSIHQIGAQTITDREGQGLKGAVKSIRVERAEMVKKEDKLVERRRFLMSIFTYDEQGYRTEELSYNPDGALAGKSVISRDDKGIRTTIFYKADGTMRAKWVDSLDKDGRFQGGAHYDADGALESRSAYTYAADGKLIEAAMYNADGSLKNKTVFKHNAEGKQIGYEVYNAAGVLMQKDVQDGANKSNTMYDGNNTMTHNWIAQQPSYELDAQGNWIKKSTLQLVTRGDHTEEIVEVLYRTISYY
ncbi:MAG: hypothetical protein H7Y30_06400 [Pyrinomonadaceae bacterium]|nr:hypothetical protein [Pyrinomonadaceae bacterium]